MDHVVSIFIHKKDGDHLASIVDSGTSVQLDISIGQITMYEIIPSSDFKPPIFLIVSLTLIAVLILGLALLLFFAIRKAHQKKQNSHANTVSIFVMVYSVCFLLQMHLLLKPSYQS